MRVFIILVCLTIFSEFVCWSGEDEQGIDKRIATVATTNIVGDIVAQVGGERLSLYVIQPLGADLHVFYPTPRDVRHVADAILVFISGAGLEDGFLDDLIVSPVSSKVVDLSADLNLRTIGHEEESDKQHESRHGHYNHSSVDPHVWMDPLIVIDWTEEIAKVLSEVDPGHKDYYFQRAELLVEKLIELDEWITKEVAGIPAKRRILVTDHDVLGYFASRYGFDVIDTFIPGFSTAAEPSARHLANLGEVIAEHKVSTVFVSTTVGRQVVTALSNEFGVEVVDILAGSLSAVDGPASIYQDFIRTNVRRIVSALDSD